MWLYALLLLLAAAPAVALVANRGEERARPALQHIHGLGVNPADGALYIATHHGLFRAPEGDTPPQPVGGSTQDIMGFSVVGPDHFVGSGHPSLGQDLPPNLGLMESRDGGETWESVSLLGEADFHVLEAAGTTVYGFDSTHERFLVSADGGRTWEEWPVPAPVFDLAVDPTDSSRLIAATQAGLHAARDEARDWRPLREDLAGLLAWPGEERLYLVDGDGRVQVSGDGGAGWQAVGTIGGQPVAFLAHGGDLYVALADNTVKRSRDGGASWTVRTTP